MTNIKDLAKMAGVSVTTVSRVLNEHPYVSEKKRTAVLEAIKATNYHKNINAVHLSKGRTMLMGVVLPFTGHPYFASLLKGIAKKALEHDYKLVLFQTDYLESRELDALQMLKEKQIDSLIICSRACTLETIEKHLHYGSIVLCENIKREEVSSTFVNHYSAFLEALEFLYQKGHQKIGYCIGRRSGSSSKKREQAYKDFLEKYDLTFRPEYIMDNCLYVEDGEKVMKRLKEMEEPPTALLVTNDQIAAGVVTCCHNEGIVIPDNLAIIGFDNQPIAKMMNITTIDIPHEQMGENLFLQAVGKEISHTEVEVKLIERGTV